MVDLRALILVRQSGNGAGDGWLRTTVGRIIFNEVLPEGLSYRNHIMDKNLLKDLAAECYRTQGNRITAEVLDKIKTLGFHYAGKSGTTIAINDIEVPAQKSDLMAAATTKIESLEEQFQRGPHHRGRAVQHRRPDLDGHQRPDDQGNRGGSCPPTAVSTSWQSQAPKVTWHRSSRWPVCAA